MDSRQRVAPRGPLLLGQQAGFDPLRQIGRTLDRLRGELPHPLGRQPLRQRIDRLALGRIPRFLEREDIIGMHDLQFLAVVLEPSRYAARLADRRDSLRPAGMPAEIDEADIIAELVGRLDPCRPPPVARPV